MKKAWIAFWVVSAFALSGCSAPSAKKPDESVRFPINAESPNNLHKQ